MKVLQIKSSSNKTNALSDAYGQKILKQLQEINNDVDVKERYTTYSDLPFLNETMLQALFVKGERTDEQKQALSISQNLVDELIWADTLIISAPIYNFSVPASLKAYFDLVARAGLTFQYSENGPVGLLKGKKAYVVITSGGTEIDSDMDFAGRYIKHFLGFIGITDVEMIKLDQMMFKNEEKLNLAEKQIKNINLKLETV